MDLHGGESPSSTRCDTYRGVVKEWGVHTSGSSRRRFAAEVRPRRTITFDEPWNADLDAIEALRPRWRRWHVCQLAQQVASLHHRGGQDAASFTAPTRNITSRRATVIASDSHACQSPSRRLSTTLLPACVKRALSTPLVGLPQPSRRSSQPPRTRATRELRRSGRMNLALRSCIRISVMHADPAQPLAFDHVLQ